MDSLALTEAQHRRRSYAGAYYPSPMTDAGVPSPPPPPGTTADAACETIPISPAINSAASVDAANSISAVDAMNSAAAVDAANSAAAVDAANSAAAVDAANSVSAVDTSVDAVNSAAAVDTANSAAAVDTANSAAAVDAANSAAAVDAANSAAAVDAANSAAAVDAAVDAADSAPPVPPRPHQPEPVEVAEIQGTLMHPPQSQQGVLTGDGGQFFGGCTRGNTWYRHPFQVRGRGRKNRGGGRGIRGGGRGFHNPAPNASPSSPLVQAVELSAETALVQEVAPATMATLAAHLKNRLWCDTCRVECYSVENLEMHKNGKRHRKTLVKLEKYEAQQKLESGVQGPTPQIEAKTDAPVVNLTEAATPVEVPHLAPVVNLTEVGTPVEVPHLAPTLTPVEVPHLAPTFETNVRVRQNGKRKKPPAFGPTRVCTMCNAMCATEAIFEVHLGSKKHTARIKRLKGPEHVYGPVAAPIVIDQPTERSAVVVEPLFFGLACRDMVEPQVNGMGEGISVQQQTVESGQVKDGAIEPQPNQDGAIEPRPNQVGEC